VELPSPLKILMIEDEDDIRELVAQELSASGMEVLGLSNATDLLNTLDQFKPHMLLLDQSMPGMLGTDIIKKIRDTVSFSDLPVMMLTAHHSEDDKIAAIELGADDFLSKPYSPRELVVRVQALVRRSLMAKKAGQQRMEIEELVVDLKNRQVFLKDQEIKLTHTEFKLLTELLKHCGEPISRDRLREKALGNLDVNDRTIDVHVLFLRRKLGDMGDRIETVRGQGYRFTFLSSL